MRVFSPFAILFFIIPLIEIYFLVAIGGKIGAGWTIFLVVLTAIVGAFFLRQQGMVTLSRFQNSMAEGRQPAQEIIEGLMLLLGGILLMTPGFFTDAIGFICLFPLSRIFLANKIAKKSRLKPQNNRYKEQESHVYNGEFVTKEDSQIKHD